MAGDNRSGGQQPLSYPPLAGCRRRGSREHPYAIRGRPTWGGHIIDSLIASIDGLGNELHVSIGHRDLAATRVVTRHRAHVLVPSTPPQWQLGPLGATMVAKPTK